MASCKHCITLIREDNEDDYLREVWRSIVVLRSSYLFHSNKLKRKNRAKRARGKRGVDGGAPSGREPQVEAQGSGIVAPTSSTSTSVAEMATAKQAGQGAPIGLPPPIQTHDAKVPASATSPSKKWSDIVSPTKPAPMAKGGVPVVPHQESKEQRPQLPNKAGKKQDKEEPAKTTEKEIKEKKGKKKTSSSSSSSEPAPKKHPTAPKPAAVAVGDPAGRYRQWIREFSRAGVDIKQIKRLDLEDDKKLKLYLVWEGRGRGIFVDWDSCQRLVDKYRGASFRKVEGTIVEILKIYKEKFDQS